MGCYVDPKNETKQEFLNRVGKEVSLEYVINNQSRLLNENNYPVCCITHAPDILAIPILYNKNELRRLLSTYDTKNNNKYYIISIENLREVSNIDDFLKS